MHINSKYILVSKSKETVEKLGRPNLVLVLTAYFEPKKVHLKPNFTVS